MAVDKLNPVYELSAHWLSRTVEILQQQLKKHKIGVTDELYQTLKGEATRRSAAEIQLALYFLRRGKFVDMGVGKGVPIESVQKSRERSRGSSRMRKAKKWYSKPWYGRLNDLNGVINFTISETVNGVVKEAFGTRA